MPSHGTGIAHQGVPCRSQQALERIAVNVGQRGTPLAVRLGKGDGADVGMAGGGADAKTQLRHGIVRIEDNPAAIHGREVSEPATGNDDNHSADGMGTHNRRLYPCDLMTINQYRAVVAAGHRVATGHGQQPLATADGSNGNGRSSDLQAILAFAQVLRQPGLARMCRLTIGVRHLPPGCNPELLHFSVFHG